MVLWIKQQTDNTMTAIRRYSVHIPCVQNTFIHTKFLSLFLHKHHHRISRASFSVRWSTGVLHVQASPRFNAKHKCKTGGCKEINDQPRYIYTEQSLHENASKALFLLLDFHYSPSLSCVVFLAFFGCCWYEPKAHRLIDWLTLNTINIIKYVLFALCSGCEFIFHQLRGYWCGICMKFDMINICLVWLGFLSGLVKHQLKVKKKEERNRKERMKFWEKIYTVLWPYEQRICVEHTNCCYKQRNMLRTSIHHRTRVIYVLPIFPAIRITPNLNGPQLRWKLISECWQLSNDIRLSRNTDLFVWLQSPIPPKLRYQSRQIATVPWTAFHQPKIFLVTTNGQWHCRQLNVQYCN